MSTAIAAPCDGGTAAAQHARRCPHRRWTLAASILASSLAFVDGSVVNVGLPAIGKALAADAAGLQWVVNLYLLPLSALLLLGGAAGDRFGRRRLFLAGIGLFACASLLCAVAPTLALLLAGRALQGASAAMLMPNSLAILGAAFAGEARGRAIGTWAAAGAVAGAVGPLLGGWLIATVGWRAIFLINLPLALAALAIAWRHVEESREAKPHPLDWLGVGVATASLAAITWGLTLLSARTGFAATGGALAGSGLAAFLLFLRIEQKRGERAIMPLALFGTASFTGLTLLTFFLYAALGGLFVLLPFVLMELEGYSPIQAGAALLPLPAAIGLGSRFMGAFAARTGPRLPLTLGPLVAAAGFALCARVGQGSYWTTILPAVLVVALGMAGAVAPLTTAVMASVDAGHVGTANGFNSAVARTGSLIATALLGWVLAARGDGLAAAFAGASYFAAGAAVIAGLAALLLLKPHEIRTPGHVSIATSKKPD
jgi:EmrB/QacA subfamily drug resistance transporter